MNTTIKISAKIKNQIKEFGNKGETYDQILARILNYVKERQVQELLINTKGTMSIQKARTRLNKK